MENHSSASSFLHIVPKQASSHQRSHPLDSPVRGVSELFRPTRPKVLAQPNEIIEWTLGNEEHNMSVVDGVLLPRNDPSSTAPITATSLMLMCNRASSLAILDFDKDVQKEGPHHTNGKRNFYDVFLRGISVNIVAFSVLA